VESGDGRIRFGLPEALRQIASRRLDATPDAARWRRAHAERQLKLVAVGLYPTVEEQEAALAADQEAAAALRWAREHQEPIAEPLAAHRALLLGRYGRLRESAAVLAPLLESPPEDPDIHSRALETHALHLTLSNRFDEALQSADEAVRLSDGRPDRWRALDIRALVLEFSGQPEQALSDHREVTAAVRKLDQARLAGALIAEAQALIAAGHLDEAEERLEEVRMVGESVNATALRYLETEQGDLAMARGRPTDALEPYARSLEKAQARGDELQVLFDLRGMANVLGALKRDEEAIEVVGLAERQALDIGGGSSELGQHLQGDEPVRLALDRLGAERAAAARARGQAVAPGLRVARACQLGRAVLIGGGA
jgi:tetratricopeptide (TPR) repeat protein